MQKTTIFTESARVALLNWLDQELESQKIHVSEKESPSADKEEIPWQGIH